MSAIRKVGTKTGGIIAGIVLLIGLAFGGAAWIADDMLANNEIKHAVKERGGEIVSIHKVKLEDSPFLDTMESRAGTRGDYPNTFYKITYSIGGHESVACFRAVHGLFKIKGETTDNYDQPIEEKPENKELIRFYGDRWIW